MAFRKAERRRAKLRLGIAGPAGSGKTASSLLMGYGITGDWSKIGVVDTENGSGELYVGSTIGGVTIGEYNILAVEAPYTPKKCIEAIHEAEKAGIGVLILDSLTHYWAGEGGLLDKKGEIEKRTGNGWTAWRDVTPDHNRLVETILSSSIHIIATLRSKMEYAQGKDERGKTEIKKLGMAPIQRDGMEYEFTLFLDIDQTHTATSSKDRTNLFDGTFFTPSVDTGRKLLSWLESGVDEPAPEVLQAEIKRMFSLAHDNGYDDTAIKQAMIDKCNKTASKDLTADEVKRLIVWAQTPVGGLV